jgi:hypothetical protein
MVLIWSIMVSSQVLIGPRKISDLDYAFERNIILSVEERIEP